MSQNELPHEAQIAREKRHDEQCRDDRERYARQKALEAELRELDLRRLLVQWEASQ